MFLTWTGCGFLVPVIAFGCALACQLTVTVIFQNSRFYQDHGWPKVAAMMIAAILIWRIGQALEAQPRSQHDAQRTGERRSDHTFLLIPMKWWAVACFVLGVVFVFLPT